MSATLSFGVVGHVDHGKTALVRALTGIETDRLAEERARGLSIVLGFAHLKSGGGVIDLIDAPGHEDFVRTMISGATAIDGILLCVAANEGPMPQTIEHFNIARLLGASRGIVVITKCDSADQSMLERTREAIARLVAGSFLADAPVVECSALQGTGVERLMTVLAAEAAQPVERAVHDGYFLPIDRAFTMHGFGLVVTGTLRRGRIVAGDAVSVMPSGMDATVRGLQSHGAPVDAVGPGERVAVNLRGLGKDDVGRGEVLATPGLLTPSRRIDAEIELLRDARPLANGAVVQLLTGTTAVTATARLLDASVLEPGSRGFVQWRLERRIATHAGERYIVRTLSPARTIGGGRLIEIDAARRRRFDRAVLDRLETALSGDAARVIRQRLAGAALEPIDVASIAAETDIDAAALRAACGNAHAIEVANGRYVSAETYLGLVRQMIEATRAYHVEAPQRLGMSQPALAKAAGLTPDSPLYRHALTTAVERGDLEVVSELVRIPGFDPFARLGERERALLARIERLYADAGLAGPSWRDTIGGDPFRESMFALLLKSGRLVRLRTYDRDAQIVVHAAVVRNAMDAIRERFPYPSPFAVKDVRDLVGSTRRHVVPLLEHLDAIGATERTGDYRRLKPQ